MARLTVSQIMKQIAATVNQEANAPTVGGSEYSLWLEYLNRSLFEWAEANDWEELRKTYYPAISASQATIPLPIDFKKLAGSPRLYNGNLACGFEEFDESSETNLRNHIPSDKYVLVSGNNADGFNMLWNPATLVSGASVAVPYYSMPTLLNSDTAVPAMADSQFMIDRTIAYILEARSDPRFQQQEIKAREKLLTMVENSNLEKFNSYAGSTPVSNFLRKVNFRVGRD